MSEQNRPDDRELDDFIAGRHESSRRYREAVEREGPSQALDHAILGQARRAIEIEQRAKRRRFVVPLALAATVVLSFSVFVGVRQQRAGSPNVALSAEDQAVIARPAPLEAQQLPAPAAPPSVAEAAATRKSALPTERQYARAKKELQAEVDQRKAEQPAMKAAAAPALVPPPPDVRPAPPEPQSAPPAAAPSGALTNQASAPERQIAPAPQRMDEPASPMAAGASADRAENVSVAPVKAPPVKSLSKKRAAQLRDDRAKQATLERVRVLKEKGDVDEARADLQKFRDAHPDVEIPDDLRPLLRPVTPPTP